VLLLLLEEVALTAVHVRGRHVFPFAAFQRSDAGRWEEEEEEPPPPPPPSCGTTRSAAAAAATTLGARHASPLSGSEWVGGGVDGWSVVGEYRETEAVCCDRLRSSD